MKYSEICILYVLAVTKRLKQQKSFYEIFNAKAKQSIHIQYTMAYLIVQLKPKVFIEEHYLYIYYILTLNHGV